MATKVITSDEIRHRLDAHLRARFEQPLTDGMWQQLVKSGAVGDVVAGRRPFESLVADVEDVWKAITGVYEGYINKLQRTPPLLIEDARQHPMEREHARSILLAHDARDDERVRRFRRAVLHGRVLTADQVRQWIQRQAKKDGPATHWLEIPLPADVRVRTDPRTLQVLPQPDCRVSKTGGGELKYRWLDYPTEDRRFIDKIATAVHGALEQLRQLSEYLAQRYGWQPIQAVEFVLTNGVPVVHSIRERTRYSVANPRIILDIDPFVPPPRVMQAYRVARKNLFPTQRLRSLSVKHMRLAAFVTGRPPAEPWATTMDQWNRENPSHRYTSEQHFARDVKQAQRRLRRPLPAADLWDAFATAGERHG